MNALMNRWTYFTQASPGYQVKVKEGRQETKFGILRLEVASTVTVLTWKLYTFAWPTHDQEISTFYRFTFG